MTAIIKTDKTKDWIVRDSHNGVDVEVHVNSYEQAQKLANDLMLQKLKNTNGKSNA